MKKILFFIFLFISQPAISDTLSDSNKLFDWMESEFPQFLPNHQSSHIYEGLEDWYIRYYPTNQIHLGVYNVGDTEVYVLGDAFGGLLKLGDLQELMSYIPKGVSGSWTGVAISDAYPGCIGQLNGTLTQNDSALSGYGYLTGSCVSGYGVIKGSVSGNNVYYGMALDNNTTITFIGTISNNQETLTGTYNWPDKNDRGTWSLSPIVPELYDSK